jgi:tRNA wybutosine-synthesizing protein 3
MSNRFEARKRAILAQLDAPEAEYHDLSPKGSVDAPIRALIGGINGIQGLVTTSSCSGRISVFLEGPKSGATNSESHEESPAGSGGKGGGSWLFIDHDPVSYSGEHSAPQYSSIFGLQQCEVRGIPDVSCRYIHLKFEPMVRSQRRRRDQLTLVRSFTF